MNYNDCIKLKKELRDKMYKIKLQIAFANSKDNKILFEEKYKIVRKEYLKNQIKINEIEKVNEYNEKYKGR